MKITEISQYIQSLYDSKQYRRAFNAALQVLEVNRDTEAEPALWCLLTNSCLNLLNPPEEVELDEMYAKTFKTAVNRTARCVEDIWEIKDSLWTAFNLWEAKGYKVTLDSICDNPTRNNLLRYLKLKVNYASQRIDLLTLGGTHHLERAFMEKNGLSKDGYEEQYSHHGSHKMTNETQKALEINTAESIFSKVKDRMSKEAAGNLNDVLDFQNYVINALITARSLSITGDEKCSIETRNKAHKLSVEICRYLFEAYVFPENQKMSLYQDRERLINLLQESYDVLAELDSEFVAPELPDNELITLGDVKAHLAALKGEEIVSSALETSSSKSSSSESSTQNTGGCYIATAVYGSYDCPEVWTLRRFRDHTLAETWYGRAFVRVYYTISPTLVKWFGHTEWFKKMWYGFLERMVVDLNNNGVENTPYEDKVW